MTITLVIMGVAVALLALLWFSLRGHSKNVIGAEDLVGRVRLVDLEAFRNLTDPAQEEFLRAKLPAHAFRTIQRERNRAALEYVARVGQNSAIFLRLGEAAQRSNDREISSAGAELVSLAISTRAYVLLASIVLRIGVIMPGTRISTGRLLQSYERLRTSLGTLLTIQQPASASRLTSML